LKRFSIHVTIAHTHELEEVNMVNYGWMFKIKYAGSGSCNSITYESIRYKKSAEAFKQLLIDLEKLEVANEEILNVDFSYKGDC